MHPERTLSYAQRYEDIQLLRCFGAQDRGFYIDIGAGHPVYDNVSFTFYLKGWSGITVEPNSWLAELSAAVRPRDRRIQSLVGAQPGEATYYLVEDFHGLSTTVAGNAQAALQEYGKPAQAMAMPVTTLSALCEQHAPGPIDFLKIDVEGAEKDVLEGGDWLRFRPKVVILEAVAPVTLVPAWDAWEPLLTSRSYRFALFDGLNRYYAAEEHGDLARLLEAEPPSFEGVTQFRNFKPALDDASHPDHRLATLLRREDMVRLPLLGVSGLTGLLTAGAPAADLDQPATPADIAVILERLFGPVSSKTTDSRLHRNATIREFYAHLLGTEQFRAALGRISASYAW